MGYAESDNPQNNTDYLLFRPSGFKRLKFKIFFSSLRRCYVLVHHNMNLTLHDLINKVYLYMFFFLVGRGFRDVVVLNYRFFEHYTMKISFNNQLSLEL